MKLAGIAVAQSLPALGLLAMGLLVASLPGHAQNAPTPAQTPAPVTDEIPNFADERTDFGVPPQATLQVLVGTTTPTSIPGGRVLTTADVVGILRAGEMPLLLVDVLDSAAHDGIPGSIWVPGAGKPGRFDDDIQRKLADTLGEVTGNDLGAPLAFFCEGARCWESYNAALRAMRLGFQSVMWYRGGLEAWHAAGLPMAALDPNSEHDK